MRYTLRRSPVLLSLVVCLVQGSAPHDDPTDRRGLRWEQEVARLASHLSTLASDVEKTTFLRHYTGQLIDIGRPDGRTQTRYQSLNFDSFDAAAFYPLFSDDRVPAACGITSFFYIKLLHRFGFKAYQYSFGFTGKPYARFIHSVALVEIEYRDAKRLIIQDPYLNVTYRTRDGEPMDVFAFLAAIKRKRYEQITMDAGSVTTSLLVPDTALYYPYLSTPCRAAMDAALTRPDGSRRTSLPIVRSYATLMQSPCDGFEKAFIEALRQHGFAEPLLYAYTLRAAELVGSADHAGVQQAIDAIVQ